MNTHTSYCVLAYISHFMHADVLTSPNVYTIRYTCTHEYYVGHTSDRQLYHKTDLIDPDCKFIFEFYQLMRELDETNS